MRVLLVQKAPSYHFIDVLCRGFRHHGVTAEVIYHTDLPGGFAARLGAFRPDALCCIGMWPWLTWLVGGKLPIVYYEWDKGNNPLLFSGVRPGPRELAFTTYRDDVPLLSSWGFQAEYLPFFPTAERHALTARDYRYEVSFVGQAVRREMNDYLRNVDGLRESAEKNPTLREPVERAVAAFEEMLAEQEKGFSQRCYVLPELCERRAGSLGIDIPPAGVAAILAKEAAHRQRVYWLGKVRHPLTVFGNADWQGLLPNATYGGPLDHRAETSAAFYRSKVNLNIQRIYALGGLSDRVFNVLAAEGFLLADRNQALLELFEDKRDLATFGSDEEFCDLLDYYLQYDGEREAIARRGAEKVRRAHLVEHRVEHILKKLRPLCGTRA